MSQVQPEPVHSHEVHQPQDAHHPARHNAQPGQPHPANIDSLIATVQREFPASPFRITGRGRTVERQAELMAQRRRQNRAQFLHTYIPARHITEMDHWVTAHPHATELETTESFVQIINQARQNGAVVSNHLSDHARDISIPHGDPHARQQVRHRLQELGGHVIDEHDAVGGPHWHVDY